MELYDISSNPVPLYDPANTANTWCMTRGISFIFPIDKVLPAQGHLLLVPIEPAQFRTKYGVPASGPILGPYGGSLSNAGEWIEPSRTAPAHRWNGRRL